VSSSSDLPHCCLPLGGQWAGLMRWPSGPMAAPWPPASSAWFLPLINLSPLGAACSSGWWLLGERPHPQLQWPGVAAWFGAGGVAAGTRTALAPAWFRAPVHADAAGGGALGRAAIFDTHRVQGQRSLAWVRCSPWRWPCRCSLRRVQAQAQMAAFKRAGTWRASMASKHCWQIAGSNAVCV